MMATEFGRCSVYLQRRGLVAWSRVAMRIEHRFGMALLAFAATAMPHAGRGSTPKQLVDFDAVAAMSTATRRGRLEGAGGVGVHRPAGDGALERVHV